MNNPEQPEGTTPTPPPAPWPAWTAPPTAGWPPPPPSPDWASAYAHSPWAPPPDNPPAAPPGRSGRGRGLAVAGILALASTALGAAAGVALGGRSPAPATASVSVPSSPSAPSVASPTSPAASGSGASGAATGSGSDVAALAAKVDPGVVDITATLAGSAGTVAGTGMILTSSGVVLTNNHVIEGTSRITVQVAGTGPTYTAKVIGDDPTDDVAVLQIQNASGLTTVSLGDSSRVAVGDAIVAIGNALGKGGTPAAVPAVVSALDQTITASDAGGANSETLSGLIQMQGQIQPGDSGGPIVNAAGQVIGITTAGSSGGGRAWSTGSTVGFAIPINAAMVIAKQIEAGTPSATIQIGAGPLLGVMIQASSPASGAAVVGVDPTSPAALAGIAAGDVIVAVDGSTVDSSSALSAALKSHRPGDRVGVTWLDPSGQQHSATVQLATGPPA